MSATSPIEVQGITKVFHTGVRRQRKEALRGVDLEVREGEIFGFLGPNGAGKTTTIKVILGLVRPDTGHGTVLGAPFGSVAARDALGYLPDLPNFYHYLSARELMRLAGRLHGLRGAGLEERITTTLERVFLAPDAWDRRLRGFSRGMLQRVGIAMATLHRPKLLILDEPMTGLDPLGRRQFRDLILDLQKEGTTIFFSSHLLADVEAMAHRVAIVNGGQVIRCGTLDEILSGGERSVELAFELPGGIFLSDLTDRLQACRTVGREIHGKTPDLETANAVAAKILDCGGKLISLTAHRDSLEDYFLREVIGGGAEAGIQAAKLTETSAAKETRTAATGATQETAAATPGGSAEAAPVASKETGSLRNKTKSTPEEAHR